MTWSETLEKLALVGGTMAMFSSLFFITPLVVAHIAGQADERFQRHVMESREVLRQISDVSQLRRLTDEELDLFATETASELKLRREMRFREEVDIDA